MKTIAIDEMTIAEKIGVMEDIWDDLCHHAEDMQSPDWHHGVLDKRQADIEAGNASFSDWHIAKSRIRSATT